jgi:hypothetical protein
MDHWMDWADDEAGFDEDLGSAETADLSAEPPLPDLTEDEPPWYAEDHGEPVEEEPAADVTAFVDEPLYDEPPPPVYEVEPVAGLVAAEPSFGVDPDALAGAYEWAEPEFPPSLDLGELPEPVDGAPWSDPELLGAGPLSPLVDTAGPDVADLYGYAGLDQPAGGDPWAALAGAEDPATSALARWWAPS